MVLSKFRTLSVLSALCWQAFARQIPVVDGVIGGVPSLGPSSLQVNTAASPAATTLAATTLAATTLAATTPGKLRVTENSGVCETTPGVYQASGYGDISQNKSIWFWFFEARNNPETAPLVVWFNGGPGSSSMIGLFQEHGPCRISNDSKTVGLNPNSWNNVANILYIDQPVGVGYSHGTTTVGTAQQAASDIWKFLQIWFDDLRFRKYATREFAVWTESYGGHYGPAFSAYFLQQNAAIAAGKLKGVTINLKALGIGDGLTDPLSQYPGYITYAAHNPYHPLVPSSNISSANDSFLRPGGCRDQIQSCYDTGSTHTCSYAQAFCNDEILGPLAGDYDVYYVLARNPDPYPPDLTSYLTNSSLMSQIGAESVWEETSDQVYNNFAQTGDWMHNSAPDLETVIESGVRTLIYVGDADYILNFHGIDSMVNNLRTKFSAQFRKTPFSNYTVAGQITGLYKNAGTFSYVRIFGAGHEVPAYTHGTLNYGQAALQFFSQIMSDQSLSST